MSGYNSPTVQQCRGCYSKIQAVEGIVHSITSLCMSAAKNGYASIVCAKFKMDKEMLSAIQDRLKELGYSYDVETGKRGEGSNGPKSIYQGFLKVHGWAEFRFVDFEKALTVVQTAHGGGRLALEKDTPIPDEGCEP